MNAKEPPRVASPMAKHGSGSKQTNIPPKLNREHTSKADIQAAEHNEADRQNPDPPKLQADPPRIGKANAAPTITPDQSINDERESETAIRAAHSVAERTTTDSVTEQITADSELKEDNSKDLQAAATQAEDIVKPGWLGWLLRCPIAAAGVAWRFGSIVVLLAVVAAVPIVQFASLGYILFSSARLAEGRPWRECLPGSTLAGRLAQFALCAFVLWLPVWLVTDLSYSAQLVEPGSATAARWRTGAFLIAGLWITLVSWAAVRGGRIRHFLWPAPIRFLTQAWRPNTWAEASDRLYHVAESTNFVKLWLLGVKAAVGAILWTAVPVSLMVIGLRSDGGATGLVGLIGALLMMVVMLYLPFLQIQMAASGRFVDLFDVRKVRRRFRFSPLAHAFALLALCLACLPLYLLRIEATPAALLWAPSLVFVLFMMPVKWLLGAAMGYGRTRQIAGRVPALLDSDQLAKNGTVAFGQSVDEPKIVSPPAESVQAAPVRESNTPGSGNQAFAPQATTSEVTAISQKRRERKKREPGIRHWSLRWPARIIAFASVAVYVGSLYVAQLVAGQGILVMYFQHAFLVPAPLISS